MKANRDVTTWPEDERRRAELAQSVFGETLVEIKKEFHESLLEELLSPKGRLTKKESRLSSWLTSKDSSERERLVEFVDYVVDITVFKLLTLLDGSAGTPLDTCLSDYILALGTYESEGDYAAGKPSEAIRVNSPAMLDLHDLYDKWIKKFE